VNLFWVLTGLMSVLALAFVLPPLWRSRAPASAQDQRQLRALQQAHAAGVLSDEEYASKRAALQVVEPSPDDGSSRPWIAAAVLALTIPAGAWLMYHELGAPQALDPTLATAAPAADATHTGADGETPSMEQAVSGLAERMRQTPDDLDGWLLLGRAYKSMERFALAREALANAYRLAPEQPDVMIEYAETLALSTPERRFEGQSLQLLQTAMQREPEHQRGLWLLGIAAVQAGDADAAIAHWQRLMALLPDDADARASLQEQIDGARARAGQAPDDAAPAAPAAAPPSTAAAPAPPATDAPAAASTGPRLTVQVDIDPALKAQLDPSAVLFVYARAPEGPRMPLAIQRLSAGQLPVTVVLDDSTSMMPQLKLSSLPQVVVGARVSKSGQAMPQPGDLETQSAPIATTHAEAIRLTIDQVVK